MNNQLTDRKNINAMMAGTLLVLFGILSLTANFISLPAGMMLAVPGVIFLAWGLLRRKTGLVIPGCILTGLSMGVLVNETLLPTLNDTMSSAVYLMSLAVAFFGIIVLSVYTGRGQISWWPIFPGGALAFFSLLIFSGADGLLVLEKLNLFWPVILVLIGLSIIIKRR